MIKYLLLLLSLTLAFSPGAYAAKELGVDAISGQMRQVSKGDNVFVSTKQAVHKGDLIQQNNLILVIMPKGREIEKTRCTSTSQCLGKIAKVDLNCAQPVSLTDFENSLSKQKQKVSKAVSAKINIEAGAFVNPNAVTIVEMSIPPNRTPKEWFSSLDDVVGRKTKFSIPAGSIVTEKFFGPRGTTLQPEEIKEF
ncbi:SAF domain-containing protein [bacterium]|nr:SAF domain-containing protein [bacterium]